MLTQHNIIPLTVYAENHTQWKIRLANLAARKNDVITKMIARHNKSVPTLTQCFDISDQTPIFIYVRHNFTHSGFNIKKRRYRKLKSSQQQYVNANFPPIDRLNWRVENIAK